MLLPPPHAGNAANPRAVHQAALRVPRKFVFHHFHQIQIAILEADGGDQVFLGDAAGNLVRLVQIKRHGFFHQEGNAQVDSAGFRVGVRGRLDGDEERIQRV